MSSVGRGMTAGVANRHCRAECRAVPALAPLPGPAGQATAPTAGLPARPPDSGHRRRRQGSRLPPAGLPCRPDLGRPAGPSAGKPASPRAPQRACPLPAVRQALALADPDQAAFLEGEWARHSPGARSRADLVASSRAARGAVKPPPLPQPAPSAWMGRMRRLRGRRPWPRRQASDLTAMPMLLPALSREAAARRTRPLYVPLPRRRRARGQSVSPELRGGRPAHGSHVLRPSAQARPRSFRGACGVPAGPRAATGRGTTPDRRHAGEAGMVSRDVRLAAWWRAGNEGLTGVLQAACRP